MSERKQSKGRIVTGVIGDDVHSIGIKVIEHALKAAGFEIASLGIRVSDGEFIDAAIETRADAILVSSLSGHARALSSALRDKATEAGLGDILMYIGGHLVIGDMPWAQVEKTFQDMGFNRVYPPTTSVASIVNDLNADLSKAKVSA